MCVHVRVHALTPVLSTLTAHRFFFVRVPLRTLGTEVLCNILEVA